MEKIKLFGFLIISIFGGCSTDMNEMQVSDSVKQAKYDIDYTSYWKLENDCTTIMSVLKIDTITNVGIKLTFDEKGDTTEKLIFLDKSKAYKIYYYNNKPYLSNFCNYSFHKNSSSNNKYILHSKDYGFRNIETDSSNDELFYLEGNTLNGPNIDFYKNMCVKRISYYKGGELEGLQINFDSISCKVINYEYYKEGIKEK